jgi:hypothetical protein
MGITAISNDYLMGSYKSSLEKENTSGAEGVGSFGRTLKAETEKKCPYSFLAKDGVIQYKEVTFVCDYEQNAITLGNMYEKEKVLKIALPSGGSLHVNVDNLDTLAKAAGMFTPEDLKAIMRAISEYNHCTRKRMEMEEEKTETAEEAAAESETPDAEKESEIEPETVKTALTEQISAFRMELFEKLINNETEVKIQIGSQEMSVKEWDKLMDRIDKELENVHEALLEKEEKQEEKDQEERIRKLFEERNAYEETYTAYLEA